MTRTMKDSGIEWIGEIPEDWEIRRIGDYCYKVKNPNTNLQETNLLSLSYGNIVQKNIEMVEGLLPKSFETYNIIFQNDIVLRMTDLQNDHKSLRTALVKEKGIITSAYITLRIKKNSQLDARYFQKLLYIFDIEKGFYGMGNGVRQGISFSDIKKISIVVPPLSEQEKIASILDEKVARIDAIIADTKQSIEELKKYKQSLITETVTKGLDKDVPMKDSGIEWIGEIPADWEILRIKTGIKRILGGKWGSDPIKDDSKNLSIIRIADFNRFDLTVKSVPLTKRYINKYDDVFIVKPSCELLIEKSGGGEKTPVGQVVKYDGDDKAGFTNFISKLTINLDLFNLSFLNYVFSSLYSNDVVKKYITQTTGIQNLDVMNYLNELIAYPPLSEQEQIANFLDNKVQQISQLIKNKEALIIQYEEYKKSMIYEYVTGKREI